MGREQAGVELAAWIAGIPVMVFAPLLLWFYLDTGGFPPMLVIAVIFHVTLLLILLVWVALMRRARRIKARVTR